MDSNAPSIPTYTIIQADGLYPDEEVEYRILNDKPTHDYRVHYQQTNLWPTGVETAKPWTEIDPELRNKVDGIMVLKLGFTAKDLDLFPNLKVIIRMGVGYDRLDRAALTQRGVTVCNCPDYGTEEVADHALALALSLRRGILLHHDLQRGPHPASWSYVDSPLVARIQQTTFGVLGLGRIGTAAALRAKAFGWHVLFYDPYRPNGTDKSLGIEQTKDIKDLFRRSTVLSVHCPCTRETRDLVDYNLLSLLPKGAVFVNTGRGETVDLDGLERCLREGIISGAGIDVLPTEPIPEPAHPLIRAYRDRENWLMGRLVFTCHTAFYSPSSFVDIREKSCQTMKEVLIDKKSSNVITPEMD